MAFGLPQDQRSQVMLLVVVACLAGGYFFWSKVQNPRREEVIAATQAQIDSLNAIIRKAKADLASGSVESMRRAVEQYRAALEPDAAAGAGAERGARACSKTSPTGPRSAASRWAASSRCRRSPGRRSR